MELSLDRQSRLRALFPPVVLLALVWAGLQILLMLFFRVALLYPTEPGPSMGEFVTQVLTGSPAAGPMLATGLLVVNVLFVVLIAVKYASLHSRSRQEALAGLLTYGGTSILLIYLQWAWFDFLRSALQQFG